MTKTVQVFRLATHAANLLTLGVKTTFDVSQFNRVPTLIKNQTFLLYKEIQSGAVAKSYMTNGLLIYGEIFTQFFLFPHILGSPSSYMTLQLLNSEFPSAYRKA